MTPDQTAVAVVIEADVAAAQRIAGEGATRGGWLYARTLAAVLRTIADEHRLGGPDCWAVDDRYGPALADLLPALGFAPPSPDSRKEKP